MSENVEKIPGTDGRKLATVRVISELLPIEGADRIELAVIDGWRCIVPKASGFIKGQKCIFIESDALVPLSNPDFAFLGESKRGKINEFVNPLTGWMDKYYRVKPVRLKGVVSEGLVLSCDQDLELNLDLTDSLGILLGTDPEIQGSMGNRVGGFPNFIQSTSLPRIQNCKKVANSIFSNPNWLATEKLHGTSVTAYYGKDSEGKHGVNVCSKRVMLEESDSCLYWSTIKNSIVYDILAAGEKNKRYIAIQGEICGPGINGNHYGLSRPTLFIYRVLESPSSSGKFKPRPFSRWQNEFKPLSVPRLDNIDRSASTIEDLLDQADSLKSALIDRPAEGIVWEYNQRIWQPDNHGITAVKVISRTFLL